jgi:DNA-binding NarL/FixJ family response regulator
MSTTSVDINPDTASLAHGLPAPEPDAGPLHLLHIEDNPADAMLMQEYIKGILDTAVFDTAERLSELTLERVQAAECAIVDLSLPDASGLDALMALRGMTESLPIIVLTGFEDLEVGLAALRYGADDYLVKNHVDGFTLERAVRYAVERRRMAVELAEEAAAATIAAAGAKRAEAALGAELLRNIEHSNDTGVRSPIHAAPGTHQVAVRIDDETGDYTLICESCDWQGERGDERLHSWRDRQLDWVLMRHVAFGNMPDAATALPTPASRPHVVAEEEDPVEGDDPMPRRVMLNPGRWLQPQAETDIAAEDDVAAE